MHNRKKVGGLAIALLASSTSVYAGGERGDALYSAHCATCHQADGGGVPFMQPSLPDSARVAASGDEVVKMILFGSAVIPVGTSDYQNEMPGFLELSNAEIAEIATYVRQNFGGATDHVTADNVERLRNSQ